MHFTCLICKQQLKRLAQELRVGIQETKARMGQHNANMMQAQTYMSPEAYGSAENMYKVEDTSSLVGSNAFGGPAKIEQSTTSIGPNLGSDPGMAGSATSTGIGSTGGGQPPQSHFEEKPQ